MAKIYTFQMRFEQNMNFPVVEVLQIDFLGPEATPTFLHNLPGGF